MSDNVKQHGGADCTWGIAGTVSFGVITNEEKTATMISEPHHNQKGQVIGHVEYDGNTNLNLTIVAKADEDKPEKGAVLEYGSKEYLITTATEIGEHQGKKKYRVVAEAWDNQDLSSAGGSQE